MRPPAPASPFNCSSSPIFFDGQLDEKDLELMNFEVVSEARTVDFIIKG